ncbi:unnamed protein product, partial [Ilex paraguariensis]
HGYPPRKAFESNQPRDAQHSRDTRPTAANVDFSPSVAIVEKSFDTPMFTKEQFDQLLSLVPAGNMTPLANVAGSFSSLSTQLSNHSWITDTVDTDYMASRPSLLTKYH